MSLKVLNKCTIVIVLVNHQKDLGYKDGAVLKFHHLPNLNVQLFKNKKEFFIEIDSFLSQCLFVMISTSSLIMITPTKFIFYTTTKRQHCTFDFYKFWYLSIFKSRNLTNSGDLKECEFEWQIA